jgi:predicted lipid-binding transport protein (Tim44 family)
MENNFQLLDIILFAAVAGFLVFRLRSVLGRRTGNERRRPDPFAPKPPVGTPVGPAAPVAPSVFGAPTPDAIPVAAVSAPGNEGLAALQAADPSFTPDAFLTGARTAFTLILQSFASGDTAALQPLLGPDVFAAFTQAIEARNAAKETHDTKVIAIKSATIEHIAIEGGTSLVTVKLVSDQIIDTRDASGKVIEGDAETPVEKTDFWTFSRLLRARNPNWTLVATHSP